MIKKIGSHHIRTIAGNFMLYGFVCGRKKDIIVVLVKKLQALKPKWLLRVQLGCLYGTAFQSIDCDCGQQLAYSMSKIQSYGQGVVIYLPCHDGQGLGLSKKIKINALEEKHHLSFIEAAHSLGYKSKNYKILAYVPVILDFLKLPRVVSLITNNPQKVKVLESYDVSVMEVIHHRLSHKHLSEQALRELEEKKRNLGHWG